MLVEDIVDVVNTISNALDGDEVDLAVVTSYINQVLPEVIHNDGVAYKKTQGWTVGAPGDEFNEGDRVDPDLVPYGGLAPAIRARDAAIYAVVQALVPYIEDNDKPVIPASIQNQTPKQREEWEKENDVELKEVDGKLTVVDEDSSPEPSKQENRITVPHVPQT